MDRILFLDCTSGISGDMAVAALLDLGADEEVLRAALRSIQPQDFRIEISRVSKNGIDCCDFDVILKETNHDHDMDYLYGHVQKESGSSAEAPEDHEYHHTHEHHAEEEHHHSCEDDHHHHHHHHRSYKEVKEIIDRADLTEGARNLAHRIFGLIARAESKAHRVSAEEVHFHEVGAMDSIVDVISFAVCYDNLNIRDTFVPSLYEGRGTVRCQHGIIPVPVPAVVNILTESGLPLQIVNVEGEIMTPTGAAIAAAVAGGKPLKEGFRIQRSGYGAGKRKTGLSGMLRAMLIEPEEKESLWRLETNVDDSTGEQLGFLMEELYAAGAREVHWIPCYMKKNRPGTIIAVIAEEKNVSTMEALIFRNTTTLGIRRTPVQVTALDRIIRTIETPFGKAKIKECIADNNLRYYPEYESVAAIARKEGIGFMDAWQAVADACDEL